MHEPEILSQKKYLTSKFPTQKIQDLNTSTDMDLCNQTYSSNA